MRPDKAKVVDEIWDEDRIRGFLEKTPMGEEQSADYSALLNAYRSMRPGDFAVFVRFYLEAGRNLSATSNHGLTVLETIRGHRNAAVFREILENANNRT